MSTHETIADSPAGAVAVPPTPWPLETGDHLTREEFERRYDAMPEVKKAELIEGVVYVASAVRSEKHGYPHANVITWLNIYSIHTPGLRTGDNCSVRLDLDNMPQPDASLTVLATHGGRVQLAKDDIMEGPPELVAEIASSSAAIDLNQKLRVYRRNQVLEYVVLRVLDQQLDWFVLRNSRYEPLPPGKDGIYRSELFPGLWLDAAAMLRYDMHRVLKVLQQGIATPEHTAFAERLRQAAAGK